MSAFDVPNLKDLVGAWSYVAFAVGMGVGLFGNSLAIRRGIQPAGTAATKVNGKLAWSMFLFAVFLECWVGPSRVAYSGPDPAREIGLFDIDFAALIALTFGAVFAFDAFFPLESAGEHPELASFRPPSKK